MILYIYSTTTFLNLFQKLFFFVVKNTFIFKTNNTEMNNILCTFSVFHKKLSYKEKCLVFLNEQIFYNFFLEFSSLAYGQKNQTTFLCIHVHNLLKNKNNQL